MGGQWKEGRGQQLESSWRSLVILWEIVGRMVLQMRYNSCPHWHSSEVQSQHPLNSNFLSLYLQGHLHQADVADSSGTVAYLLHRNRTCGPVMYFLFFLIYSKTGLRGFQSLLWHQSAGWPWAKIWVSVNMAIVMISMYVIYHILSTYIIIILLWKLNMIWWKCWAQCLINRNILNSW